MDIEAMRNTFNELLTSLSRLRDAEQEIENLKGTVRVINERVQSLVAENDGLKHELYTVVAQRDNSQRDGEYKQSEIDRLNGVVGDREGEINRLSESVHDHQNTITSLTNERDAGLDRERNHQDREKVLEDQIYHLTETLSSVQGDLDERVKKIAELEREVVFWQARFNAVQSVLDNMRNALENVPAVVTPAAAA